MSTFEPRPLQWPEPNPELEAAIGRAILSWSVLEHEIDDGLRLILRVSPSLGDCVTANLQLKTRLDIFQSALHELLYAEFDDSSVPAKLADYYRDLAEADRKLLTSAEKLARATDKLAGEMRNWIAHGRPHRCEHCEGWMWMRRSARKGGVKLHVEKMEPAVFENGTAQIRALVERWRVFNGRIGRYMKEYADIEAMMAD